MAPKIAFKIQNSVDNSETDLSQDEQIESIDIILKTYDLEIGQLILYEEQIPKDDLTIRFKTIDGYEYEVKMNTGKRIFKEI